MLVPAAEAAAEGPMEGPVEVVQDVAGARKRKQQLYESRRPKRSRVNQLKVDEAEGKLKAQYLVSKREIHVQHRKCTSLSDLLLLAVCGTQAQD